MRSDSEVLLTVHGLALSKSKVIQVIYFFLDEFWYFVSFMEFFVSSELLFWHKVVHNNSLLLF